MKPAAILARVSTPGQRELSLDTQADRALGKLRSLGYEAPPDRIIKVDWTSLDLYHCPEFQKLRGWVLGREISALGILDRDRLNAQGLQRLMFLSECKDAGVDLVICQGPPIMDEPEGQLVELALAIGKERSVLRAGQGARDGLRDRVRLKGLPAMARNPYGYCWNEQRTRLLRTAEWPNLSFICRCGLEGTPMRRIRQELRRRGIPSPSGKPWWTVGTIHGLLTNPAYGGRFHALRWEKVLPSHRKTRSYGKSTSRHKPLQETTYLANVVVESPPLAWEDWLGLQERLQANKAQAKRHAKRDYLLRSLVICDTHQRRYQGHSHCGKWVYQCPRRYDFGGDLCPRPNLAGPDLEEKVKAICREVLLRPDIVEQEIQKRAGQVETTVQSLESSLSHLNKKESRNRDTEANLVMDRATGRAAPEAYERCLALVKAERTWINEERQRLQDQLDCISKGQMTLLRLAQVRETLLAKLDSAATEDWRLIFNALALEVHVTPEGPVEVALAIPVENPPIVSTTP